MPGTFGCGRKAHWTQGRRNENQYISENFSPHTYLRHAYHPDGRNKSIRRTQSAPTTQNNDLSLLSFYLASGNKTYAERRLFRDKNSRLSGHHVYGHTSVPHTSNVSHAAKIVSRKCEKRFEPLSSRLDESLGAFAPNANSDQNSNKSVRNESSFHQIYGPSLIFRNSSHNPSSVDATSHVMGNFDIYRVHSCGTRNKRPKSPSQHPHFTMRDVYTIDADTLNHNSGRPKIYQRDHAKHKAIAQHVHCTKNNKTMPLGESDAVDMQATSSLLKSFREDICRQRSHDRRSAQRHPVYRKGQGSVIIYQDEDQREKDYSQRRSRRSQNLNYQNIKLNNDDFIMIDITDEQCTQPTLSRTKDLQKHSRQRQSKDRLSTQHQPNSAERYGTHRTAADSHEMNDVKSRGICTNLSTKSSARRDHVYHNRRSHMGGCWKTNDGSGSQISSKRYLKNAIRKNQKSDITFDLPVAELTAEWLRFRNAEEAGDWLPTGQEGIYANSPPFLRFLHFLKCQSLHSEGELLGNAISRQPANPVKSKPHIDLPTKHHLHVKSRQIRTSSATAPPCRVTDGLLYHQSCSFHPSRNKPPAAKAIYPIRSSNEPDVSRWDTLPPALQVEHAAVITNQLYRAMVLQAFQGQRKICIPGQQSERKAYSRETGGPRSCERPRSVPVFRTTNKSEKSDAASYTSRPKQEQHHMRGSSRRAHGRNDKFLDEKSSPRENRTPKITPLRGGGTNTACDRPWCPTNQGESPTKCRKDTIPCREGVPVAVFNFTECAATFQQYMHTGECGDDIQCLCE